MLAAKEITSGQVVVDEMPSEINRSFVFIVAACKENFILL